MVSATSLHGTIGFAKKPLDLRLRLSRGRVPLEHKKGCLASPSPYNDYLLDSSVPAMLITQLPRVLLNIAVFLYLIGFGLYTLFTWLEDVPDNGHDYRNIFTVFIISLGCCIVYVLMCALSKILHEKKLGDDFQFQRLGEEIDFQYRKKLDTLGKKTDNASADGADLSPDLVYVIKELTIEIAQLREAMALKHE